MADEYPRLRLKVQQNSYGFAEPAGHQVQTKLNGGFSNFSKGLQAGATNFNIALKFKNTDEAQYFSAFIKGGTRTDESGEITGGGIEFGSTPFIMEMVSRGILEDHLCWIIFDSINYDNFRGLTSGVRFQVEVEPLVDDALNDGILDLVDSGIEPGDITPTLDRLTIYVRDDLEVLNRI